MALLRYRYSDATTDASLSGRLAPTLSIGQVNKSIMIDSHSTIIKEITLKRTIYWDVPTPICVTAAPSCA